MDTDGDGTAGGQKGSEERVRVLLAAATVTARLAIAGKKMP